MKAPRKTAKRPIFRHIEINENEKIEAKDDITKDIIKEKSEEKDFAEKLLDITNFEFPVDEPSTFIIEPVTEKIDDFKFNLDDTLLDIIENDTKILDFTNPIDYESFF